MRLMQIYEWGCGDVGFRLIREMGWKRECYVMVINNNIIIVLATE